MDPARQAFCALFFLHNGGHFVRGRPIFQGERGNCDVAYDCGSCGILGKWILERLEEGYSVDWQCQVCISEMKRADKERKKNGGETIFPGYYQSGGPTEPGQLEDHKPKLDGCTTCGRESFLLQLVLRR